MTNITIIVPCYNNEQYITDAIESIKAQSYHFWECIIVNDGSTDKSEEKILSAIKDDDRFTYIKQENLGPGAARNNGAKLAKGKYMTMLDSDDIIGKDYLSKAVSYLDEHDKCVLYYGYIIHFDDTGKEYKVKPKCSFYWQIFTHNIFNTTCVYRTKDFQNIGGYNEQLDNKEDWEFYIRLLYRNRPFYIDDVLAFKYRHHEGHRNKDGAEDEYFMKIMKLNPYIYEDYKNITKQN